jgi:hypothetical protein
VPRVDEDFFSTHAIDRDATWFPSDLSMSLSEDEQSMLMCDVLSMQASNCCFPGVHYVNPYGLLRSPWNWNPATYLARYHNVNGISDMSSVSSDVRSYFSGVHCSDYERFLDGVRGQPLNTYLQGAEDAVHGTIHFTFGGAGGDYAYLKNQELVEKYSFSNDYLVVVAQAAQTFVKKTYPFLNMQNEYLGMGACSCSSFLPVNSALDVLLAKHGFPFPLDCPSLPWDPESETLTTTAVPGEEGATCSMNEYFCQSQSTMDELYSVYFSKYQNKGDPGYEVQAHLLTQSLDAQCSIMKNLVSRHAFDGDMAGI